MPRKAISKKLRFDIFKRDSFKCQYCGSSPPSVILHVDHINPVAAGGTNNIDNLITSCSACNLGKSCTPLTDIPKSLKDKADEIKEREMQIIGYNKILQEKSARIESEAWAVAETLERSNGLSEYNMKRLISIKYFLEKLPAERVIYAAEITAAKWSRIGESAFRYFCGVCWGMIRRDENGSR